MAVVVVTGCSSGIGLETALAFARRGDRVHATMRDPSRGGELRRRTDEEGLKLLVGALDVRDAAAVERVVREIVELEGTLDVAVANAGIGRLGTVEEADLAVARDVMDTNFWGAYHLARSALPFMRAQGSGVIVLVSSIVGRIPPGPGVVLYGVSKHAVGALADTLDSEASPFGVRTVAVEPGFFATSIVDKSGAVVPAGSPYEATLREALDTVRASVDAGDDPAVVADAIVGAATDPATPIHLPVGDDAALMIRVFEEVGYGAWADVDWANVTAASRPA